MWELFFAARRARRPYRQLAVNVKGKTAALRYGEDGQLWDSRARVRCTTDAGRWTVVVALPLARLVPGGLGPRGVFYANLYRQVATTGALVAWSPNFVNDFHELTRLGRLTLE